MKITKLASVQEGMLLENLSRAQVKELQKALSLLGYPVGDIDGFIGPKTQSAWAKFADDNAQDHPDRIDPAGIAVLQTRLDALASQRPVSSDTTEKVIVSNISALTKKYGDDGVQQIRQAVQALIDADKKRGLATRFIALDEAATMQEFAATPVSKATDPKQNLQAIDAIYRKLAPDYIMLLGAIDVIPHQDLLNPMYDEEEDEDSDDDRYAYGDLPYACETPYNKDIRKFLGPTRVVGRLPDVTGGKDVQYLLNVLKIAANYKDRGAEAYFPYFGISAKTFKGSTAMSLASTFRNAKDLKTVPEHDENWPFPLLNRLSHFINCHGSLNDSRFFGEPGDDPPALDAKFLENRISEGTVVAAECCYGGQLFDPADNAAEEGRAGITNTYMANKAYGYFGSTTIAYGMIDETDSADLICQFFLQKILQGASLGRACLEARQKFIRNVAKDPSNLKTIAQFNLYGDPSIHPVTPAERSLELSGIEPGPPLALSPGTAKEPGMKVAHTFDRTLRRQKLFLIGIDLLKKTPIVKKVVGKINEVVEEALEKVAAAQGLIPKRILTFDVEAPALLKAIPEALKKDLYNRVYVIFCKSKQQAPGLPKGMEAIAKKGSKVIKIAALIAKEMDGKVVSVKKIVSR